jgi:DNA end-binding protein Ku
MATGAPRVLWKGAISFGLVHIPVALHTATADHGIDFDWLDKRSMDPVGYKRINKVTKKDIERENIVKGVKQEDGRYVIVSDEEIAAAYPTSTQSIDIETFISATEIPFVYLDRPYYLAPLGKGAKVYALLRETLMRMGRVGIARVVIQTKQHLAVLVPSGAALVLNLLRWEEDIKSLAELNLPPAGVKAAGLSDRELKMAQQLVEEMSAPWHPEEFKDSFRDKIMELVEQKLQAGESKTVKQVEKGEEQAAPSNVIDLTELLQRSLKRGKNGGAKGSGEKDSEDRQSPGAPRGKAQLKVVPAQRARADVKSATRAPAKKAAAAKRRPAAKRRAA